MNSKPCKVLLAGDVGGSLQALFKRVTAVNKSSGPFDVLLCTGSFFQHSGRQFSLSNLLVAAFMEVTSKTSLMPGNVLPSACASQLDCLGPSCIH